MTKPASELIALADEISIAGYLRIENGRLLNLEEKFSIADALRAAANQSGSERAGVDALEIARAVRQRAANLASGHPKNDPEHLRWLHHSYGADEVAYQIDEALATPPAQPAPAATHGKPDGAVREALEQALERMKMAVAWWNNGGHSLPQMSAAIEMAEAALSPKIAAAETSPGDAYREVIDEGLIARHLGVAKGNAKAELNQILDWDVAAALDPAVSGRKA